MLLTVMDKDNLSSDMLGYSYLWIQDANYTFTSPKKIKLRYEQ